MAVLRAPLVWMVVKAPISEMIVCMKRDSEAKQTLQPK